VALKKNDLATLTCFEVSCVRLLKLLRFNEVYRFFDHFDF
jgi:hypothetical protein